jgi:hypothetical protein
MQERSLQDAVLYIVFHEDPQIMSVRPERPAARRKSFGKGTVAIFTP